ncbi:hypothetical protein BSL78_02448 [Apostichopus japonicus]|uniref:Uncharacterized protein n=1 Tax=Stichopus japonicus TaxID=307972 RepID=A0A2G8LK32_STIJA|nr:hypothetical protein BSL78_02448 [Apostichopus japonicus]
MTSFGRKDGSWFTLISFTFLGDPVNPPAGPTGDPESQSAASPESEGVDQANIEPNVEGGPEVLEPYQFEPVKRAEIEAPKHIEEQTRSELLQGTYKTVKSY